MGYVLDGKKLKELREKHREAGTQEKLALALDIDKATVYRHENGGRAQLSIIHRYAEFFGVEIGELAPELKKSNDDVVAAQAIDIGSDDTAQRFLNSLQQLHDRWHSQFANRISATRCYAEFVSPPGCFESEFLLHLTRSLTSKDCVVIRQEIGTIDDRDETETGKGACYRFWNSVRDALKDWEGFRSATMKPSTTRAGEDNEVGVADWVTRVIKALNERHISCALIVTGMDATLADGRFRAERAKRFLSVVKGLSPYCSVIITGTIELESFQTIMPELSSVHLPEESIESDLRATWSSWSEHVIDDVYRIERDERLARVMQLAGRHPASLFNGIEAIKLGHDPEKAVRDRQGHDAKKIKDSVPNKLRSILTLRQWNDGSCSPAGLRQLINAGILQPTEIAQNDAKNEAAAYAPLCAHWETVWAEE